MTRIIILFSILTCVVRVTSGQTTITSPVNWDPNNYTISNGNLVNKFNLPPTDGLSARMSVLSNNWDLAGGFGMMDGGNIVSPIVWMYDYGGRNAFTVARKTYSAGAGQSVIGDYLTPLFQVRENGYVGIGTTNPQSKLEVHGTTAIGQYTNGTAVIDAFNSYAYFGCNTPTNGLAVGPTGNVGIGTTLLASNSRLDIQGGGLNIGGSGNMDATLHIKTSFGNWDRLTQIHPSVANKPALNLMASTDASLNYNWWSWGVLASGIWAFQPSTGFGGTAGLFIDRGGKVGIGNSVPDGMLTVSGQVHAQEVKVTVNAPGPDYVFEKDYKLTSLEEIKTYIEQNKHLPEVPSAKEMEKNGVQLGEMNMLLLKKIEELTLYVIEQNKKIESQSVVISQQNERITKLEKLK